MIDNNKEVIDNEDLDVADANEYISAKLGPYLGSNFLIIPAYSRGLQKFSEQDFDDYVEHLKYLEFNEFSKVVGRFLEALIIPLKSKFDYVLIDNRTGLAETAIWNIRKFSDLTVWVLTLSLQNIEGVRLTYRRYSTPLKDSSTNDSNSFIFVANITPPLPELSKKHRDQLARILDIPVSKIINIPYAPKPILDELFPHNSVLDQQYKSIVMAILEENENTPFFKKLYSQIGCSFFSLDKLESQFLTYRSVKSIILESDDYNNLIRQIDQSDDYNTKLLLLNMLFKCLFKNKAFDLVIDNYNKYIDTNEVSNETWISIMVMAYQASIIIDSPLSGDISNILDKLFLGVELTNFDSYLNSLDHHYNDDYLIYLNSRLYHIYNELMKTYSDIPYEDKPELIAKILSLFKVWFLLSSKNVTIVSFLWPPKKESSLSSLISVCPRRANQLI